MWHAKPTGTYPLTTQEGVDNMMELYNVWLSRGWTKNAICGTIGNMWGAESGGNPWRWQGDSVRASTDDLTAGGHAYGLGQLDPSSKYILNSYAQGLPGYGPNFSDRAGVPEDGNAQALFIDWFSQQWTSTKYTFDQYKSLTLSPEEMARLWMVYWEKPGIPHLSARQSAARSAWDILQGVSPSGYITVVPGTLVGNDGDILGVDITASGAWGYSVDSNAIVVSRSALGLSVRVTAGGKQVTAVITVYLISDKNVTAYVTVNTNGKTPEPSTDLDVTPRYSEVKNGKTVTFTVTSDGPWIYRVIGGECTVRKTATTLSVTPKSGKGMLYVYFILASTGRTVKCRINVSDTRLSFTRKNMPLWMYLKREFV